jgi:hypothetical protein
MTRARGKRGSSKGRGSRGSRGRRGGRGRGGKLASETKNDDSCEEVESQTTNINTKKKRKFTKFTLDYSSVKEKSKYDENSDNDNDFNDEDFNNEDLGLNNRNDDGMYILQLLLFLLFIIYVEIMLFILLKQLFKLQINRALLLQKLTLYSKKHMIYLKLTKINC